MRYRSNFFSVARFADFMSSNNQIQKTGASVAYNADSALPASDPRRSQHAFP
jgi:hypothetical protein